MMTRRQFASAPLALTGLAATSSNFLSAKWSIDKVHGALLKRSAWTPFPKAADRAKWGVVPAALQTLIIADAEQDIGRGWPALPASLFLEFRRNGNRQHYETPYMARRDHLAKLVMAECCEGRGRFLDEILNGLWLIAEESSWVLPAHLGLQKTGSGLPDTSEPVVDLFCAETGALLAWSDYLLGDQLNHLSPLALPRLRREVQSRILQPCWAREDFDWMGFTGSRVNNWNPWINSNWLTCVLLIETDDARRSRAVNKILRSLDHFLSFYSADGGCDEGPGYWDRAGASLFDCLELLHSASAGRIDFYSQPLIAEIGRYIVRMHIADDWYVNFADAEAKLRPSGELIHRYGVRVKDTAMQSHGAWLAQHTQGLSEGSLGRALPECLHYETIRRTPAKPPLLGHSWLPSVQVGVARREAGAAEGLFFAAQGGHNAESHNHNDVGNFIVYSNGRPALIDIGVETYTRKTFSPERYDIWTMQSVWHNCPTINGIAQSAGREFAARSVSWECSSDRAIFRLDLSAAYPKQSACRRWMRTLRFDRKANRIELLEEFDLSRAGLPVELNFVCPVEPRLADNRIVLPGRLELAYDTAALQPQIDDHDAEDPRLKPAWGGRVWRIRLRCANAPAMAKWSITMTQPAASS
ncbi:MAG: heparinase II/III family protein [Bryobacteraceae bacterium]